MDIMDKPGALPKEYMRKYFEGAITQTEALRKNTPLGTVEINGVFQRYIDPDTDTLWLGFALGMRCAERISKASAGSDQ